MVMRYTRTKPEPFLLLHREHGTGYDADGAETAAIDGLVSS